VETPQFTNHIKIHSQKAKKGCKIAALFGQKTGRNKISQNRRLLHRIAFEVLEIRPSLGPDDEEKADIDKKRPSYIY
jgi:hypothetical protein